MIAVLNHILVIFLFSNIGLISSGVIEKSTTCPYNFCSGGGICSFNSTGLPVCTCYVGYTGDNCEINPCELLDPCGSNGNCYLENSEPHCDCHTPWAGTGCLTCDCGSHGTCDFQTFNGIAGVNCICDSGYKGLACEMQYCSGNGNWTGSSCNCFSGYSGVDCENVVHVNATTTAPKDLSSNHENIVFNFVLILSIKLVF